MRKEAILEYGPEVVQSDINLLDSHAERLMEVAGHLPEVTSMVVTLLDNSRVKTYGTSPRPGLRVLHAAYQDLENRHLSGTDLQEVGNLLVELSGVTVQAPAKKAVLADTAWANGCHEAEGEFSRGLIQVMKGRCINQPKISVYHDEQAEPLLFRKDQEEDTALTLVPVSIDGMVVPRGTIVTVNPLMDSQPTGNARAQGFTMASYQAPLELIVQPLRLSAWAYENPLDRALFATRGTVANVDHPRYEDIQYFEKKAHLLARLSLENYQVAARKVIELCA